LERKRGGKFKKREEKQRVSKNSLTLNSFPG